MSPLVSVVSLLLLLELCRGQRGHTAEERCTQPALVSTQYENCSKQLMASPLDFPSREITKQAAEAVLKPGMTFAFLGDSTMHQQYERLCSRLGGHNARMKWKYKNYMSVPGICNISLTNSTLKFFGIGKKFAWGLLPRVAVTLNNTMTSLSPSDVVILNLGVHWSQSCFSKFHISNDDYLKELLSLKPFLDEELQLCQKLPESKYPLLLWKETGPQHFPTSNGHYPDGQRFHGDVPGLQKGKPLTCHELTSLRVSGAGLREFNSCNPNCLPATWQNDLANAFFKSRCTDILPVWDDLRCLHEYHLQEDKWDCTHYNLQVIDVINFKMLRYIAELKKKNSIAVL